MAYKSKRAKHIEGLVENLTILALDSMYFKGITLKPEDTAEKKKREKLLKTLRDNIAAHLCCIVENNPEQAEALMQELNLAWTPGSKYYS